MPRRHVELGKRRVLPQLVGYGVSIGSPVEQDQPRMHTGDAQQRLGDLQWHPNGIVVVGFGRCFENAFHAYLDSVDSS